MTKKTSSKTKKSKSPIKNKALYARVKQRPSENSKSIQVLTQMLGWLGPIRNVAELTNEPKRMVWKRTKRRLGGYKPQEKGGGHPLAEEKSQFKSSGYPKCVPRAKANRMSAKEKASAVRRKRAKAQGVGGKPTNVRTKAAYGGKMYFVR